MNDTGPIALFGAGGETGMRLLRFAHAREQAIRAFEHNLPPEDERLEGIEYIQCDVLKDEITEQLRGCCAVVSTLGVAFGPSAALDPPPLYTQGTRNILDAMKAVDVDRIAVMSAAFVEEQPSVPAWFELTVRPALTKILEQMREMEAMLEREADLKWTAVRPGWLIDLPFSGEALVANEKLPEGCFRCRHADVANFLLRSILDEDWVGAKPAIGKPEAGQYESPRAIKSELGID